MPSATSRFETASLPRSPQRKLPPPPPASTLLRWLCWCRAGRPCSPSSRYTARTFKPTRCSWTRRQPHGPGVCPRTASPTSPPSPCTSGLRWQASAGECHAPRWLPRLPIARCASGRGIRRRAIRDRCPAGRVPSCLEVPRRFQRPERSWRRWWRCRAPHRILLYRLPPPRMRLTSGYDSSDSCSSQNRRTSSSSRSDRHRRHHRPQRRCGRRVRVGLRRPPTWRYRRGIWCTWRETW
mmetsp:Transcript_31832/g.80043  ORF Transcript_31832/g.80043 Transcript_31832/m.80043 type:complete len:238 (+) Transcript_31832:280-993(+)